MANCHFVTILYSLSTMPTRGTPGGICIRNSPLSHQRQLVKHGYDP